MIIFYVLFHKNEFFRNLNLKLHDEIMIGIPFLESLFEKLRIKKPVIKAFPKSKII